MVEQQENLRQKNDNTIQLITLVWEFQFLDFYGNFCLCLSFFLLPQPMESYVRLGTNYNVVYYIYKKIILFCMNKHVLSFASDHTFTLSPLPCARPRPRPEPSSSLALSLPISLSYVLLLCLFLSFLLLMQCHITHTHIPGTSVCLCMCLVCFFFSYANVLGSEK